MESKTKYLITELIKIKRSKKVLSTDQINFIISEYSSNKIPDYQMSSLLMAIFLNGLNKQETLDLTNAMLNSGQVIDFNNKQNFYVDKHSSGGIGDKTSMILASIVACFPHIKVPMISGRGLGHTGGTLDKLDSIPNFNTQISTEEFKKNVEDIGLSIMGQTKEICPADKKIYSLRDVTATVESLPLICASIMSKKLAEGIDGLVLDIKVGSGAFMKNMKDAVQLAKGLKSIGLMANKKMSVLITNMDQPLGRYCGNVLEIRECIDILQNRNFKSCEDTRSLSIRLAAEMIFLSGRYKSLDQCIKLCEEKIINGEAYNKFNQLVKAHGGSLEELPFPKHNVLIGTPKAGYIQKINTEQIGLLNILLKAGRAKSDDQLDYTAGIEIKFKIGDKVSEKDILFVLYGNDLDLLKTYKNYLFETNSVIIGSKKVTKPKLVIKKV